VSWAGLWFHGEPIPVTGSSATWLDRVAAGGPAIVLVEGEAGIGKTRLLAQVVQDAAGRGMQVAAGRAEELERTRPFGLLAAAFGCARSGDHHLRAPRCRA
jgi:AAA ATPase domain